MVAGGFHSGGGMDKANAALARHLAESGTPVHLVTHRAAAELQTMPHVTVHDVPRPGGSDFIGESLLALRGRAVAREILERSPDATVVVNGGNCIWPDVNWVHSVHHAWSCVDDSAPVWFKAKNRLTRTWARRREKLALREARLVVAHSARTRGDLVDHLNVDPDRIRTIPPGSDPDWGPAGAAERASARAWLGKPAERPIVAFVGALGHDRNKGFDTLWSAWQTLCARHEWDADLVAAGGGRAVRGWREQVRRAGLSDRVTLLGFTDRIRDLLAAADLLVSPVRYEAYGLNVHEAICRGLPALVSSRAGIAERYPKDLSEMILGNPDDVAELTDKLLRWRSEIEPWRRRFAFFGASLRAHTWSQMAREIVEAVEATRDEAERR